MALVIRMRQQGRKNRQTFRLVVTDSRNPRDGKYLESLGSYDPSRPQDNLVLNEERLSYWMSKGAQISERAERLVRNINPSFIKGYADKKRLIHHKYVLKRRRLKTEKAAKPKIAKSVKKAEASSVVKKSVKTKKAETRNEG